jgi:hypothetical protein
MSFLKISSGVSSCGGLSVSRCILPFCGYCTISVRAVVSVAAVVVTGLSLHDTNPKHTNPSKNDIVIVVFRKTETNSEHKSNIKVALIKGCLSIR